MSESNISNPSSGDKPKTAADKYADLLANAPQAKKPQRVIGPKLRVLLVVVLALFTLLLANGFYLSGVTFMEWWTGLTYQNYFYQFMFLAHLLLGAIILLPVIIFGIGHWKLSKNRRNRRAVNVGYALLFMSIGVLISGILLVRVGTFGLNQQEARRVIYWLHVLTPLGAMWLYWIHRLVGPKIKWYVARRIGVATIVVVGSMIIFQMQDPRKWNQAGPKDGEKYFQPSLARTASGNFIPAKVLMHDDYCKKCHPGIYDDWFHSAHRFSSFNNPAYLYAIRETRAAVTQRDGTVQASRWCAGCHDPVPFFSGAFDAPDYDDVNHVTSQAGITCTACHAITHINSNRGNADYVIDQPVHYPFAYSENPVLQLVNELLVKAKPSFHNAEMLKPLHKTPEFCSSCHKVHLPKEVTAYKDFLRGQNHYDSYLLSGVAGHGARSFYYPPKAETNCNHCHMPFQASNDFAARYSEELGKRAVHDHFFPAANTALPYWRGEKDFVERAKQILVGSCRVDIFGVREGGVLEGKLTAPIRPEIPVLESGKDYLLEAVIRTLKMGHHFTQGTVDSNEAWLEVVAKSGDRVIGISGGLNELKELDKWSHYVNNFVIDRNGNRIARRNAQDIFIALYDHQIPPGAGQTAHYRLTIPEDLEAPVEVTVKLNYRKFDKGYIDFMNSKFKNGDRPFTNQGPPGSTSNELPITTIAQDRVVFSVKKKDGSIIEANAPSADPPKDVWQRWNDYGIGLFLTGKAQLRQAGEAFRQVEAFGRFDGPLNLARVALEEGNLNEGTEALQRAAKMTPPPPAWTFAWLSGEIARLQGQLEEAEKNFRSVIYDDNSERRERKFDFSLDYVVRNQLALTLVDLAVKAESKDDMDRYKHFLDQARHEFEQVLKVDSENMLAHQNLADIYQRLGDEKKGAYHREMNVRYKADDNAADVARPKARSQYPYANFAAEPIVIYSLQREGAYGLPEGAAREFREPATAQQEVETAEPVTSNQETNGDDA